MVSFPTGGAESRSDYGKIKIEVSSSIQVVRRKESRRFTLRNFRFFATKMILREPRWGRRSVCSEKPNDPQDEPAGFKRACEIAPRLHFGLGYT